MTFKRLAAVAVLLAELIAVVIGVAMILSQNGSIATKFAGLLLCAGGILVMLFIHPPLWKAINEKPE